MDQIIVKHVDGSTQKLQSKEAGSAIRSAKQTVERLGQDVVDISVESVTKLTFQIGDKITVIGRDYTLNQPARESKVSSEMYKYDLQFEGVQYDLMRANYNVNVDTSSSEIQDLAGDTITGDLKMFLDVLIANATRVFPGKWVLGSYPESTETKTLTFADDDSCLTVLQMLCSEDNYNTEFKIDIDQNGVRTLRVGEFGNVFPFTFEHKRGKGLYNLTREKLSTSNIITKLFVYGSSKNINTSKYRASKLCLPLQTKAQSYIENSDAIAKYGVWEKTITFDEVFPKIPGRPTGPGFITGLGVNVYEFYDAAMDFDLNEYLIPGTAAKVHFNTGNLAGYEFEIIEYDHMSMLFTIKGFTDENGYSFPNPDNSAFQFAENDDYVLVDIDMPKTYKDDAEERLSAKGEEHLSKHSTPQVQYGLEIDKTFLDAIVGGDVDQNIFWTGDYIPVLDADFELNRSVRVKSFTRDLLDDYPSYSGLKIADFTTSVTLLTRIVSDIKGIDSIVKINNLNDPARARRNWKVTTELITMLETIQAEAALIGNDPAAQYTLSQASFKTNIGGDPNSFFASNCIIAHNYYPVGNPGSWIVSQLSAGELDNQPYYLYIKADKAHGGALFLLSLTKISVESVAGFYHFPVGVLSSVVDGRRSFQTTKGYTLITGGDIKTGRISSTDGQKYFDLDTGEIKGSFKFVSGESVEDTIAAAQSSADGAQAFAEAVNTNLQAQIDGVVDSWFYPYTPTLENYPASGWATSDEKHRHVGDTFTNTEEYVDDVTTPDAGKSWRYVYDDAFDVFLWTPIADSDAVKALLAASKAQYTADGKRRVFSTTPTNAQVYDVGDLWVNATFSTIYTNDLLRCKTAKAAGAAWSIVHWEKASKYTDDTAANAAAQLAADANSAAKAAQEDADAALEELTDILSDGVLSASEKPSQRQAWDVIAAEKSALEAQANTFSITTEKTAYTSAFQTLANYLNAGSTWSSGIPSWLSDANLSSSTAIVGRTYRARWKAYYDARTALLNAVSTKAKQLADAAAAEAQIAAQTTGRNLISTSPVVGLVGTAPSSAFTINYAAGLTTKAHRLLSTGSTGIFRMQVTYRYPITSAGWYAVSFKYKHVAGIEMMLSVKLNLHSAGTIQQYSPDNIWKSFQGLVYVSDFINKFFVLDIEQTSGDWFDLHVSDIKVESGKTLSGFSLAPEDSIAQVNALDYLKQAMQDSTDVQGGLLSTSVLLLKTLTQVVGGMSGLTSDPVAMWTGGTYAQAQADALKPFKSAMTTGGMDKKDGSGHRARGNFAWDEVGNVAVRGLIEALSGLIGNFKIADGNIVGYNTDGSECLRIAIEDIPLPSTIETGAWADLSSFDLAFSGNASNINGQGTYQTTTFDTSTLVDLVLPYATKLKFAPLLPTVYFTDPSIVVDDTCSYRLRIWAVGNPYAVFDAVYTNQEITLPAGAYDIELTLTFYIVCVVGGTTDFTITLNPANKLKYQESVRKSAFGRNGFYSYFSPQEYIMFRSGLGLVAKGNTDLPGVLAAGTINSDGSRDSLKKWGAKNNSLPVNRSGAGVYIIPHAVGHTNYMVYITPAAGDRTYYVTNKTSATFTVVLRAGGSNSDTTFDYVVVGAN